jgi:predicted phospho-2-dehydro-3-deoxyheptonate aldolase
MNTGKTRRLKRIFQEDNRTVLVPIDHGVTVGPIEGIENMQRTINQLEEGGADAIVVHKGIAKRVENGKTGLIVMLSASSNLSPNCNEKVQVCTIAEAVRLGADAVSIHINVGAQDEDRMLATFGRVSDECDIYGMPLLAMMYPRGPKVPDEHAADKVAHAARLGAELGADIVKTCYTGDVESFKLVTESCPAPVVIAGGPKTNTAKETIQVTLESMEAGSSGLSIGRNVFQHEKPTLMVSTLSAIVHKGISIQRAMNMLGETI